MRFPVILMLGLLSPALMRGESLFEQAARMREAARQRAFDRGQKTALPAAEKRESIASLPDSSASAERSADGVLVKQGAPSANVYNRVMEERRYFKNQNPWQRNANDTFIDDPAFTKTVELVTLQRYPELSKKDSAFALRHAGISRWVDSHQPPLARDSRRKLLIAHMVSLELYGRMREDSLGMGKHNRSAEQTQKTTPLLDRNHFEITVSDEQVSMPDGAKATFQIGRMGMADEIRWNENQQPQSISIPQAMSGSTQLPNGRTMRYQRVKMSDRNWKFIFTP